MNFGCARRVAAVHIQSLCNIRLPFTLVSISFICVCRWIKCVLLIIEIVKVYSHNRASSYTPAVGACVSAGQRIGTVGNLGAFVTLFMLNKINFFLIFLYEFNVGLRGIKDHLHFEIIEGTPNSLSQAQIDAKWWPVSVIWFVFFLFLFLLTFCFNQYSCRLQILIMVCVACIVNQC